MNVDLAVLQSLFESRVNLSKMTEMEAVTQARDEWVRAQTWVLSESKAQYSFLWHCDQFDLDPSAVRRAIRERL